MLVFGKIVEKFIFQGTIAKGTIITHTLMKKLTFVIGKVVKKSSKASMIETPTIKDIPAKNLTFVTGKIAERSS